jgi:uncharacterized membrane protein YjjB (DUF3815 family)
MRQKRLLAACGFVGAVAWTIYQFTVDMDLGKVGASFLGSLIPMLQHLQNHMLRVVASVH